MSDLMTVLIILVALVGMLVVWRSRGVTIIYPPHVGLLYRNGRFERQLEPGRYVFFDPLKRINIVRISTAPLPAPLGELSVISKDQFSFRVGLSPIVEVVDARAFAESQAAVGPNNLYGAYLTQASGHAALQPLTSAAAVQVVGGQTLRDVFADSAAVVEEIRGKLEGTIPGANVSRVLLTSVTLPPETRRMFTDVERSKIEAEAALERARGEQAALRALANAARLIKDNPALANLRLLQTLETAPGAKTFVLGSGALSLGGSVTGDGS